MHLHTSTPQYLTNYNIEIYILIPVQVLLILKSVVEWEDHTISIN